MYFKAGLSCVGVMAILYMDISKLVITAVRVNKLIWLPKLGMVKGSVAIES
jgi:hypothetical protein